MEVLRLSGYVLEEKLAIATQYLVPEAITASGLCKAQIVIEDGALELLIKSYCREAGVRNLKQHVEKIMRKVAFLVSHHTNHTLGSRVLTC